MKKNFSAVLFAASALCISTYAHASSYDIYGNQAEFESDFGSGLQTYTVGPVVGTSVNLGSSGTIGPIIFTNSDGDGTFLHNDGEYGTGVTYLSNEGTTPVATGSGTFYAMGFLLGELNGASEVTYSLNGLKSRTIELPGAPDSTFFGIIAFVPIESIIFSDTNGELDVLSVETDAQKTSPVPEPSSIALLGTGVLSVGGMVRRRFVRA